MGRETAHSGKVPHAQLPAGNGEGWECLPGLNCGSRGLLTAGVGGGKSRRALRQKEQRTERARSRHLRTEITLYGNPNSLAGSKRGYMDCCFLSEFKRLGPLAILC